ncbi:RDD family protein [Akkermansiaceae bacterium]|nr:RDD family protein [Akkermansiaceae bacterium]MDB4435868.1 RDD family protein [Akkermansiaceae bacterium]MDB4500907.1 RDD family protein [Akkermansiaceae bacterium]
MDFWIIEDGEKRGPLPDYTLREMIRDGKVTSETKVWHEGASSWVSAQEVGILAREFELKSEPVILPPPLPNLPVPPKAEILWRRLGARWLDFSLAILFFIALLRLTGFSLNSESDEVTSGWLLLAQFVPALILEGILIHLYGQTPGKYLMALSVESKERGRLKLGASVMRSMRVWVLGLGMGVIPLLGILGHGLALWMIRKKGAALWDLVPGHQVKGASLTPLKIVMFFLFFICIWGALIWVMWPYIEPEWEKAMKEAAVKSFPVS